MCVHACVYAHVSSYTYEKYLTIAAEYVTTNAVLNSAGNFLLLPKTVLDSSEKKTAKIRGTSYLFAVTCFLLNLFQL
jgi:hypothetical protein